ncbi:melanopsin-A-like [Stylophora pistillata]|uniref:melanopsin-A-like n=1 Tax=Stylophora pistillata TaxID=50429 RepID=UPI000C03CA4A|nr:melanopsin-A-like [Stylophora pistillata]
MNVTLTLPPRSTFVLILESSVAIIFMLLALIGNFTVCLAIFRKRLLRTVPNYLLLNLASADILSAVVSFPLLVSVLMSGKWMFSESVCQFQAFQSYISYSCSLLTLTVTSITRYYATVHPFKHRGVFKVKIVLVLMFIVWTASCAFAAMPLLGLGRYQFEVSYALCIHDHNASSSYNTFSFTFLMVNSTVIVTCYSRIFKAMKTRNRRIHRLFAQGSTSRQLEVINAQEAKLTNTIFFVICLFSLCYIPTIVLGFLMFVAIKVSRFARMLSTFSVGFTSVVNPIVYWVRSKAFRKAVIGIFRKNSVSERNSLRMDVGEITRCSNPAELVKVSRDDETVRKRRTTTITLPEVITHV